MRWLVDFYNERRGISARYGIEAPLPPAAVVLGRRAVLAEYPSGRARGRLSLLEQAERAEGHDGSGWVLYRIVKDDDHRHLGASGGVALPESRSSDSNTVQGTAVGPERACTR